MRPKNRWEDGIINDMKKLKIRIGLAASKITISGNYMLRRPKHSKNEVVVPKEEEEYLSYVQAPRKEILWKSMLLANKLLI
jgi:hypothetical protein